MKQQVCALLCAALLAMGAGALAQTATYVFPYEGFRYTQREDETVLTQTNLSEHEELLKSLGTSSEAVLASYVASGIVMEVIPNDGGQIAVSVTDAGKFADVKDMDELTQEQRLSFLAQFEMSGLYETCAYVDTTPACVRLTSSAMYASMPVYSLRYATLHLGRLYMIEQTIVGREPDADDDARMERLLGNIKLLSSVSTATPTPTLKPTATPEPTATVEPTVTPEPTSTPEPEEQIETIDWAQLRLDGNGDSARLVIGVNNADGVRLEPFAVAIGGDTDTWQADDFWMDGASLSWENGEIVLWVYDGVAQGGEVLCGGRRLTLTLSRNGDAETMLTLAALDGDGNELDLRNSGDGRIKLQAHWDAKVIRQPVQIETELISNGSDGLAYGDTLEMTAVVNVQPTDAKWSIRWQYSLDGEHFEDVEGANEMRYAVKLDKINAQYYWRFVVSVED